MPCYNQQNNNSEYHWSWFVSSPTVKYRVVIIVTDVAFNHIRDIHALCWLNGFLSLVCVLFFSLTLPSSISLIPLFHSIPHSSYLFLLAFLLFHSAHLSPNSTPPPAYVAASSTTLYFPSLWNILLLHISLRFFIELLVLVIFSLLSYVYFTIYRLAFVFFSFVYWCEYSFCVQLCVSYSEYMACFYSQLFYLLHSILFDVFSLLALSSKCKVVNYSSIPLIWIIQYRIHHFQR